MLRRCIFRYEPEGSSYVLMYLPTKGKLVSSSFAVSTRVYYVKSDNKIRKDWKFVHKRKKGASKCSRHESEYFQREAQEQGAMQCLEQSQFHASTINVLMGR